MTELVDSPLSNDNRNYAYEEHVPYIRAEHQVIANLIPPKSSVLDLACGDGSFLTLLGQKDCISTGVELSKSGVQVANARGLNVVQGKIDVPMPAFKLKQFDYAVCNVTLQMVMYPEILLNEMGRVSKKQIVSFPNFAHYKNRLELLFKGQMPKAGLFGYNWYSTGHIHQLSVKDFELFCAENGFHILQKIMVGNKPGFNSWLASKMPNLFSRICIFLVEKK